MGDPDDFPWFEAIYNTVVPTISAFGIVGNVLNLLVLTRMKSKASTIVYFTYMAASDLVTCSLLFVGGIAKGFTLVEFWWYVFYIYIYLPICNSSMCISALIIVMVTLERIITIRDWDVRMKYCTRRTAHRVCAFIIPICVVINIPYILVYHVDRELGIQRSRFYSREYLWINTWTRFSLLGIFPAVFLSVGNVVLICSLRCYYLKQKALLSENKRLESKLIRDQTRLTATLIGVIVMFLLGDFTSYLTSRQSGPTILYGGDKARVETFGFYIFRSVFILPMIVNYSFNFALYCALNSQFLSIARNVAMCRREDATQDQDQTPMTTF